MGAGVPMPSRWLASLSPMESILGVWGIPARMVAELAIYNLWEATQYGDMHMYELTPVLAECSNMAGGHVNSKKRRASERKRASRARACMHQLAPTILGGAYPHLHLSGTQSAYPWACLNSSILKPSVRLSGK